MRGPDGGSLISAEVWRDTAAKLPAIVPVAEPTPSRLGQPLPPNLIGDRKPNFIERILDSVVKDERHTGSRPAKAPTPGDVLVMVALLKDDFENVQRRMVIQALEGILGILVEAIDRDLEKFVPGLSDTTIATHHNTVSAPCAKAEAGWPSETPKYWFGAKLSRPVATSNCAS